MMISSAESGLYAPLFPKAWARHRLYDLASWENGRAFKTSDFSPSGVPIIKIAEIKNGISPSTKYTQNSYEDKYRLRDQDILFCWSGQPETSIGTYRWRDENGWLNQHIFKVLANREIVTDGFLYQILRYSKPNFVAIARNKQTTGLGHITKADLRTIEVAIPKRAEQQAIASTLGALDDKIASNNRASILLWELFDSLLDMTAAQASARLVPLEQACTVTKGRSYSSAQLADSDTALVTLKSIGRGGEYNQEGLKPYTGPYNAEQSIQPGEIVVAQTDLTQGAEVVGRGVRVPPAPNYEKLVASLDLLIVRPRENISNEYLLGLLRTQSFHDHCRNRVSGTTVLHLSKDAVPTWPAPIASPTDQHVFSEKTRPLLALIDSLESENTRLAELRDTLLPALMSGRIRVPEAQEAVEQELASGTEDPADD